MFEVGQRCPNCNQKLLSITDVYCAHCGMILKGAEKALDQSRVVMLQRKAEEHFEIEEWTEGIYLLIDALRLAPQNEATHKRLQEARSEFRLSRLYEWAEEHYFAQNFSAALQNLREIQETDPNYRDIESMMEMVESESFQKNKKHLRKNRRRRFVDKFMVGFYYVLIMGFVVVAVTAILLFFSTFF